MLSRPSYAATRRGAGTLPAFVAAIALMSLAPIARADVPVAPPPREVGADGSRDPVPAEPRQAKENPLDVVERIVKNSQAVGNKLAKTDTGSETRGKQTTILKDIDSLIDQQENPPPMGGDSNDKKNDDKKNQDKKNAGKNNPDKDSQSGMDPQGNPPPRGRKPRQGESGGQPKNTGKQQAGAKKDPGMAQGNPMGGKKPAAPQGGKNPANPMGGKPSGKPMPRPSLPIDDAVVKEVWGHLPDKLRQQVSQYYKEEFMPKYSELLKQYYSSLANTPSDKR
ncbi:MAG TPA: hypothetical protein VN641_00535 [Urbifossiella sp.]|nr:hypothetical protein [Urbifossiella sp.]